jgi:hypothetical protein
MPTAQPLPKGLVPALTAIVYSVPDFMAQDTSQFVEQRAVDHSPDPPVKPGAAVRIAEYALLAAVVAGVIDTLRFAAYFIPMHFALNFEEGKVVNAGFRIMHGLTPYPPVGQPPYYVNVYGPVFYYVMAPLVRWFGISFTAPRLLVLASGLATALFLVLLLRHWTKSWVIALGFGLSFLAASLVRDWIYVLRVDLFGLALVLAGLYVFVTSRRLLWPALLFLAALFTKITFLAAPVACILYLWFGGDEQSLLGKAKERRRAWRFTGWMLLFGSAGLVAFGLGTNGWGLFDMFMTHAGPYRLGLYVWRVRPFALLNMGLVAGAIALAIDDVRRRHFSLPLLYVALASVMTLTAGKRAADGNHLLDWQAALCLAAGCGYYALRKRWRAEPVLALIPIGVILLAVLGLGEHRQVNPALAGCPAAYHFAATQPGQLLTENPGIATFSGKKIWLNDSFEYSTLGRVGRLDQRPLIRMVRKRYFSVILLGGNLPELQRAVEPSRRDSAIWPPQFVSALARNYHPVASFACAYANTAYEPNATPKTAKDPPH